ncbi:hypothetical protein BKA58DRAFT_438083 [Alternaria rosae]|uniref:uncharacterized protein n=1 Tax=Alternaria rosae TaxID=1187941 RepID=UPI001E8CFCD0|nr:uncharacterized protein BKA58DRAFT_438083 [Alternaria rosae]KAH6876134.1 hypothetical protein BKA58DRAFT_438083 [Alternaria rosae]
MKTLAILLTLSTLVLSCTAAAVHPHIHRRHGRCAPSSSVSNAPPAPAPTTLVTSVSASASVAPPASSAPPPAASASPPVASPPAASASVSTPPTPSSTNPDPSSSTSKQITIAPSDTLEKIAAANAVGMCDIAKANNIHDPNLILAGEMLTIPVLTGEKDDSSCMTQEEGGQRKVLEGSV